VCSILYCIDTLFPVINKDAVSGHECRCIYILSVLTTIVFCRCLYYLNPLLLPLVVYSELYQPNFIYIIFYNCHPHPPFCPPFSLLHVSKCCTYIFLMICDPFNIIRILLLILLNECKGGINVKKNESKNVQQSKENFECIEN